MTSKPDNTKRPVVVWYSAEEETRFLTAVEKLVSAVQDLQGLLKPLTVKLLAAKMLADREASPPQGPAV